MKTTPTATHLMLLFFFSLLIGLPATVHCQNFEGRITYKNTYKSRLPNVTDEQFTSMMGATQDYFIKGGNYRTTTDGALFEWQLYTNKDNRLYTKMSNSDTAYWSNAKVNTDSVLKVVVRKGATEILGYKCDEVTLTCKSGKQKYYFSSALPVDISLYTKHLYGNWYEYLKTAKALPLKSVIENKQFTIESVATVVKPQKLDDREFQLPKEVNTAKSPY